MINQLDLADESFHIGVVTADLADDGLLRRRADGLAYIASTGLPDGGRDGNVTGDLLPVFGQLADAGVRGSAVRSALETMRRALDGRNPGFRRAGAGLTVVFVLAGDDASADAPAASRAALGDTAFVAAAIAGPSPRMAAFIDTARDVTARDVTAPLGEGFASQLSIERGKWTLQGGPCLEATSDTCSFAYAEPGGGGALIPACTDTDHLPCWRIVDASDRDFGLWGNGVSIIA